MWIGIMHVLQVLVVTFYPFIIPKNFFYDFIYLLFILSSNILWYFYGTCPITYYHYKYYKKSDIDLLINTKSNLYIIIQNTSDIITALSVYIVCRRSNLINTPTTVMLIIIREYYSLFVKKDCLFLKYQNNKYISLFNFFFLKFYFLYSVLLLVYMFYKNKTRFINIF